MRRRSTLLLLSLGVLVTLALSQLIAQDPAVPSGWREVPAQLRRGAWAAFSSAKPQESTPKATPGVAQVAHIPGVRLVERMPPGEDPVEFVYETTTPFVSDFGDDPRQEVEARSGVADAIAVVEVIDVQAAPTTGEDGIESTLDMVVKEVLKSGEGLAALAEGQHLRFRVDGGTLAIAGRQVTVRRIGETLPRIGGTYLYFFGVNPVTYGSPDTIIREPELLPYSALHNFEIVGGELHRMWRHPDVRGGVDRVRQEVALDMVRAATEKR
jgi:hypothetical protein